MGCYDPVDLLPAKFLMIKGDSMSNRLIDLQHITKIFDGEKVLDDLNLYIRENEFLTLLGPSGCGKTTTLRIIGGFLFPDEGSVIFDGKTSHSWLRINAS